MNKNIILHLLSAVIALLAVIKLADAYEKGYSDGLEAGCELNESYRQYFLENCGREH